MLWIFSILQDQSVIWKEGLKAVNFSKTDTCPSPICCAICVFLWQIFCAAIESQLQSVNISFDYVTL